MKTEWRFASILKLVLLFFATQACSAFASSFTEEFATSSENWLSGPFAPLTYNASGGPDGSSYVSSVSPFNGFVDGATAFRGHDDFNASGDAFVGNWLLNGWVRLSAWVRHDAPVPVEFFTRIATSANFPAVAVENGVSVDPNVWTFLEFDASPLSSEITIEGATYPAIFSGVGNIQIGLTTPAGFEGDTTPITLELDKVTVSTPEPTTAGLVTLGLGVLAFRRKRD